MRKTIARAGTALAICIACLSPDAKAQTMADAWKARPRMPVARAVALADRALGPDARRFYCVTAALMPGGPAKPAQRYWLLTYVSPDLRQKMVSVSDGGHVSVRDQGRAPLRNVPAAIRVY